MVEFARQAKTSTVETSVAQRSIIPDLRPEQRRRIQHLSDKTRDKVTFRRCQIVLRAARGESARTLAQALDCSVSTVSRTLRAFTGRGETALRRGQSTGRPPHLTDDQDHCLDRAL